jgi:hypothetical protein
VTEPVRARSSGNPAARRRRRLSPLRIRQSSIVSRWPEVVGIFRRRHRPESIRFPPGKSKGVLTIVVEGIHAPMMQHVAPVVMERVNLFFGYPAVEQITIRQGAVQASKARRPAGAALARTDTAGGRFLREVADQASRLSGSLARGLSLAMERPWCRRSARRPIGGDRKK